MSDPLILGEFEHVVLLAILRLGDKAYGVTIRNEIQERTGREPRQPASAARLIRRPGRSASIAAPSIAPSDL